MFQVAQPHLIPTLRDFQIPQSRLSELDSSWEAASRPPHSPVAGAIAPADTLERKLQSDPW